LKVSNPLKAEAEAEKQNKQKKIYPCLNIRVDFLLFEMSFPSLWRALIAINNKDWINFSKFYMALSSTEQFFYHWVLFLPQFVFSYFYFGIIYIGLVETLKRYAYDPSMRFSKRLSCSLVMAKKSLKDRGSLISLKSEI